MARQLIVQPHFLALDDPGRGQPNCCDCIRPNNKDERKPNAVLLIAASLIAAVRLNREEIKSSPAVHSKIADSIRLPETTRMPP
jgi:hypothetical protein